MPSGDRLQMEHELALKLGDGTTQAMGELFEKFEFVAMRVRGSCRTSERRTAVSKRLLHPLLLSSRSSTGRPQALGYRGFRKCQI